MVQVVVNCVQVEYAADVFWTSPGGYLEEFSQSGVQNVSTLSLTTTIAGLIPDTTYHFRVSAVTEFGQGAEVVLTQPTGPASGGK